jgi:hypothetical protein
MSNTDLTGGVPSPFHIQSLVTAVKKTFKCLGDWGFSRSSVRPRTKEEPMRPSPVTG